MNDPIRLCLDGKITPETAVARLLLAGETASGVAERVRAAEIPGDAWQALSSLVMARGPRLERVQQMLAAAGIDHTSAASPAAIAALFDRALAISPEASVAAYSLGDADSLAAATAELIAWLAAEGLVRPASDVLDLGCGIGRVAGMLGGHVRSVLGLDVSAGMIAEARRRCAGQENLRFNRTSGADLAVLPDASFDLVLAVDCFPYLHQAGVAGRHVADAARILRDGGALAIFNLSYREDPDADRSEAAGWAERHALMLRHAGITPFMRWDGAAYLLIKAGSTAK